MIIYSHTHAHTHLHMLVHMCVSSYCTNVHLTLPQKQADLHHLIQLPTSFERLLVWLRVQSFIVADFTAYDMR